MKPKNLIESTLAFVWLLSRFKREVLFIFHPIFSFDLIDSSSTSLFLLFFFLLQLAQRECIHKVAVHSASGLNYGSYFLWVAGWYPTFVYRSLRYGNALVYTSTSLCTLLPLKLPRPSSTTSPNHYRATRRELCRWNHFVIGNCITVPIYHIWSHVSLGNVAEKLNVYFSATFSRNNYEFNYEIVCRSSRGTWLFLWRFLSMRSVTEIVSRTL